MKTKFFAILLIGAMAVSCDEFGSGTGGSGNGSGASNKDYSATDKELEKPSNPVGDPLTPEESRAKLQEIGLEIADLVKPDSQTELLEVIDEFYLIAEDLEVRYGQDQAEAADAILQPMKRIAMNNVRAVSEYSTVKRTYIYGVEGLLGTYTHNGSYWEYTESKNKFELIFKVNGQETVISAVPSGQTYEYSTQDEYEDWDYETDEYVMIQETITVKVPGKIEAKVTKGGKDLANLTIEGQYKLATSSPIFTDVNLVMGDWNIKANAYIGTSSITDRVVFSINGETVLNAKAEAKGSFDLDPEYYEVEDEPAHSTKYLGLSSLEAVTKILDLRIEAGCKDVQGFETKVRELNDEADRNENPNGLETGIPYSLTESFCKKGCDFINNSVVMEASYENGPVFAKVQMKPQFYEGIYYYDVYETEEVEYDWDGDGKIDEVYTNRYGEEIYVDGYEPLPVLVFTDDGALFSFEDFFTPNKFNNVIEEFQSLSELYMNCMPNIR